MRITLQPVQSGDLSVFFAHQKDAEANRMAAFTARDPKDRTVFDAKWKRILEDPHIVARSIFCEGELAGHVAGFEEDGRFEVTYWLGREFWGRGVATQALAAFLGEVATRPVYARVAEGNEASRRVLEKCGFVLCGHERGFAPGRGEEVEEDVFMREAP